jgi:ATP/maltotriose-dependent transcriptional regulator MalT
VIREPALAFEALARHDWATAYEQLQAAGDGELDADGLDALAEAAWWLSHIDACIDARGAAFYAYQSVGDDRRAGQCAVWLFEHHCFKAQPSIAATWLRRGRRALAEDSDCVEYGNLLLREAELLHSSGDLDQAAALALEVIELARRLRSEELEALALQTAGRVAIDQGRPDEGLKQLDEAMLFAVDDRLSPYATGKVYCSLITACDELGDLSRAAEWTEATVRWSQRHPQAVFPGLCRVHHAQILGLRGSWTEAEAEAQRACNELENVNVGNAAAAWAEIGDIRRRIGDLDGAEEAFGRAEALCGRPSAGVALLRLAQGRLAAACTIIQGALEDQPWNRLARAKLLPARIQIEIAAGDLDAASAAVDELEAIAAPLPGSMLEASAATCRGRLALAHADADDACRFLRRAVDTWLALDVPYEVATARLLLGQSCRMAGDDEGAASSLAAAVRIFDELGAILDARHTRAVGEQTPGAALPRGLTAREVQVLVLVAQGSTNKVIAAELGLSIKTIARHLENIFVKIGVSTRSGATAFALANGLTRTDQ